MALEVPKSGFTKNERSWIAELVQAINGAKAIQGENVTVTDGPDGQTIAADDCDCDLCP